MSNKFEQDLARKYPVGWQFAYWFLALVCLVSYAILDSARVPGFDYLILLGWVWYGFGLRIWIFRCFGNV